MINQNATWLCRHAHYGSGCLCRLVRWMLSSWSFRGPSYGLRHFHLGTLKNQSALKIHLLIPTSSLLEFDFHVGRESRAFEVVRRFVSCCALLKFSWYISQSRHFQNRVRSCKFWVRIHFIVSIEPPLDHRLHSWLLRRYSTPERAPSEIRYPRSMKIFVKIGSESHGHRNSLLRNHLVSGRVLT